MRIRLVDEFDGILVDLDGVVYTGKSAIDGATEALKEVVGQGTSLAYVTNNASRSPAEVAEHLRELGAPATAEQVFGSAQAGAELLARDVPAGASVLVVGSQTLTDFVRAQGLVVTPSGVHAPEGVIQGFSPTLGWRDLAEASYAIAAGAVWIATNLDMTLPQERGFAPGNGTLVAAVAAATGRSPLVAGKPEAALFETAAHRSRIERALVIGDRLDTDILGGNRAGMATALVLTGVDSARTALGARPIERPTFMLDSVRELFEEYPAVTRHGEVYRCGAGAARVSGSTVFVSGDEGDLNSWRAACASWWAAYPEETPVDEPKVIFGMYV